MTLALPARTRRRRPSLTPMIDVVFLLLVFFMLAARFGTFAATPVQVSGGASDYTGPPRLITLTAEEVRLNGRPMAVEALVDALAPLMETASDMVLIRPAQGASVQDLLDLMQALRAAGLRNLSVLE